MRSNRLLVALVLVCSIAPVLGTESPVDTREAAGLFNHKDWSVAKALRVNLGGGTGKSLVVLLRSNKPRGASGVGDPMFGVDLLVVQAGKCEYRLSEQADRRGLFIDDVLEARDVTGDGTPEILFHSGEKGASDWTTYQHVLYRQPDDGYVWDIAPRSFYTSWRHTFRWLTSGSRTYALVADPIEPASTADEHMCHGCPKYYQYSAFSWVPSRKAFVRVRSMVSRRAFTADEDPLVVDLVRIQHAISNPCPF